MFELFNVVRPRFWRQQRQLRCEIPRELYSKEKMVAYTIHQLNYSVPGQSIGCANSEREHYVALIDHLPYLDRLWPAEPEHRLCYHYRYVLSIVPLGYLDRHLYAHICPQQTLAHVPAKPKFLLRQC